MSSSAAGLWGEAVTYINQRNTTERSQIGLYLNYLTPETVSDSELIVSTDNSFAKSWIERHYFPDIKDAIFNVYGRDLGFRIVIADGDVTFKTTYQQILSGEKHDNQIKQLHLESPSQMAPSVDRLSQTAKYSHSAGWEAGPERLFTPPPDHAQSYPYKSYKDTTDHRGVAAVGRKGVVATDERTFDNFIVGDSNRYAFSIALGVAKAPGENEIYNPLFIYGNSGLGKTHLLIAIENYIKLKRPYLKTTYAQTSDFLKDFTSMLHDKDKRRDFEQKYHHVDVILLDDLQYLEGKEETTNEVFQILNSFVSQNKQVVLSADRAPYNIAVHERHTSRYAAGSTIDIQPPSFETKYAIFEKYFDYCCQKIDRTDLKDLMTREIIDRIIELSSDNIRELNGATASLVAYLSIRQNKFNTLTIEEVEERVLKVFIKNPNKHIDITLIQKVIENFYKISHNDLMSKKRSQGISYPRQIAMYLSRNLTGESYPDIGKAFGGKDHTSVMYACNQIEKKRQLSKKVDKEIESLIKTIRS